MIKKYITGFCLISFIILSSLLFFSCSDKTGENEIISNIKANIGYYVFENTSVTLNKKKSSNFFIPASLESLLKKVIIKDGNYFTVYEFLFQNHQNKSNFILYPDISGIYDCHSDNCEWVDECLISIEEQRIGIELEKMENILNSPDLYENQSINAAETEELILDLEEKELNEELKEEKTIPLKEFKNFDNSLSLMEYGSESLIPKRVGDTCILIHSSGNDVKRFFYDNKYRCFREEHWNIKKGESEKSIKTVTTDFRGCSYIPLTKVITTDDFIINQLFNESGYKISQETYKVIDKDKSLVSKLNLKYNKNNKVIESSVIDFNYKDDSCEELDFSFNKKYLYKYSNDDIPPDFDYYENGSLKISREYSSKDNYATTVYFTDGYRIKSFYKNNKLVKEIFTINGIEERIKNYEE